MDVFEAIKGRRSIRSFKEREVEDSIVEKILDAARWAPSWANSQCARYVVVRTKEILLKLGETLPPTNPARGVFAQCSFCIAVVAKHGLAGYKKGERVESRDWYMFDSALATQNICLAAYALGLGSVIVGLFDHKAASEVLKVPQGYETVCLIPIGEPDKSPAVPSRKPLSEIVSYESFSRG
ncbi:MAG: nitroreductase family protein [Planctomycetota bacterium]|nr:nitroreductase family protein [Planctomycetota bacterium]